MFALLTASLVAIPAAHAALTGSPQVVASGLQTPWEVVVTPDGRTLVTERTGTIREVEAGGTLRTVYEDPAANKFLGMALHPNYASNGLVYLYATYAATPDVPNANRVIRLRDDGTNLVSPETVFNGDIRSDGNHDGGRIKFGPDGKLYVTTGDVHNPSLPQSLDSLNGKILRLEMPGGPGDGGAPADNPFNAPGATGARPFIWSIGHRHPQGIGWDACGRMWETEHGPSGESHSGQTPGSGGHDEINRIDRGADYGWPTIIGDQTSPGMRNPVVHSGPAPAWAPGGLAIGPDGRLYAPLLAGQRLTHFSIAGDTLVDQQNQFSELGRQRAATVANGFLYLTTDGSSAQLLRVPFDAAQAPTCPTAINAPLTAATPRTGSNRLKRLLVAWSRTVRRAGLRSLRRHSHVKLRVSGLPRGILGLRLYRRGKVLALGRRRASPAHATTLTLKLTKRGRTALRRRPKAMRLVLRGTL
ncbi:MAG: PQQ-dependent sugar dehydrogenase, partial [Acidimicrobiia bacterium]|nr:PQQ-dependent sugar dehydrogenase [Acidimicrobiia bacterium]